jgi:hypothetical protein
MESVPAVLCILGVLENDINWFIFLEFIVRFFNVVQSHGPVDICHPGHASFIVFNFGADHGYRFRHGA